MSFHSFLRTIFPFLAQFALVLLASAFVGDIACAVVGYSQQDGGWRREDLSVKFRSRLHSRADIDYGDADWQKRVTSHPDKQRFLQFSGQHSRRQLGRLDFIQNRRIPWEESDHVSPVFTAATRDAWVTMTTSRFSSRLRANDSLVKGDGRGTQNRHEVAALLSVKAAISRDPLRVLRGWHPNASSACDWVGVLCSSQKHRHHVIALNLQGRQLGGNIGLVLLSLGRLRFLQQLDLSFNRFHGFLSGHAFANLSSLETLDISYNLVGGPIPSEIGGLKSLKVLDLAANNLTGKIPSSLGNCTNLTELVLSANLPRGRIPDVFHGTPRLKHLDIGNPLPSVSWSEPIPSGNSLSGSLPPTLVNCSSLLYLNVSGNLNLGGDIPFKLSLLTELQMLVMTVCSFTGTLSPWLGNMSSLVGLYISFNHLTKGIPDEVGKLSNLTDLVLDYNLLSVALPRSITNCTRLAVLSASNNDLTGDMSDFSFDKVSVNFRRLLLGGNRFTGIIPPSLANCSRLEVLAIGANSFHAHAIPKWMGSFSKMVILDLQGLNLHGVIPREVGKLQKLEFLNLQANNLTGVIPSSLANCTELGSIFLNVNGLTGIIPSDLGDLLGLSWLYIGDNFLTGSIPNSLTNCSQMSELILSANFLRGSLSVVDWGKFSQLQFLELSANHYAGSIPSSLSNCSNLYYLSIGSSELTGHIPVSLSNLSQMMLEVLSLQSNQLSGKIPAELFKSSTLIELYLAENNLEGVIPSEVGECISLETLSLVGNNIHGRIPESLGNCSQMTNLLLWSNKLSGALPLHLFSKMVHVVNLDMSQNLLSGPWPEELGSLQEIQTIQLSGNTISGSILLLHINGVPSWYDLTSLDVSSNNLNGSIPASLGLLPKLAFFNVSYNNFQGSIPVTGIFQHNLTKASFLGNPGLCEDILGPGQECPTLAPTSSSSHRVKCKGFNCKRVWVTTTCVGSGLLLGVLFTITGICRLKRTRGRIRGRHQMVLYKGRRPFMTIGERDVESIIHGGEENVIGHGAYSVVYKGLCPDGRPFAIKTLKPNTGQQESRVGEEQEQRDEQRLFEEVHTLAQLRHRNVVKVLGICSNLDIKAIILEYMPEGSLHKHLYISGMDSCQLLFQTRLRIALGIAEGMKYLHHDLSQPLIHGDLKPSIILLDSDLTPKIANFGVSKFVQEVQGGQDTSQSTICGTVGYIPPEYALEGRISTRGDVFGYGVVLLELLTGRPPTGDLTGDPTQEDQLLPPNQDPQEAARQSETNESGLRSGPSEGYRNQILTLYKENSLQMVVDSKLQEESTADPQNREKIKLMLLVALLCTRERPQSRPTMSDVAAILGQINGIGANVMAALRTIDDLVNEPPLQQQSLSMDTDQNSSL